MYDKVRPGVVIALAQSRMAAFGHGIWRYSRWYPVALVVLPGRQGRHAVSAGVHGVRPGVARERVVQINPPRRVAEMQQRMRGQQHRATGPNTAFHDVAWNAVADDVFDRLIQRPESLGAGAEGPCVGSDLVGDLAEEFIRNAGIFQFAFGGIKHQRGNLSGGGSREI